VAIAADAAEVTPGYVCANEPARLVQPIAALTRYTEAAIVGPVKEFHDFGAQSAQLLMEHVDPAGRGVGCGPLLFCHGVQKRDIRQCFRSFTIAWLHASLSTAAALLTSAACRRRAALALMASVTAETRSERRPPWPATGTARG
jgi:hypothetical protein